MKTLIKRALVLSAIISFSLSCQTDRVDIQTGIIAQVYVGSGDCMPGIDYSKRLYSQYSGRVYIIQKKEYDKPGNTIESLKAKSLERIIQNGVLAIALKPDSFVVFLDNAYESSSVIYLKENSLIKTHFYFFKCTSY